MLTWYFLVYFRFQSIIFDFHAFFYHFTICKLFKLCLEAPLGLYVNIMICTRVDYDEFMTAVHKAYVQRQKPKLRYDVSTKCGFFRKHKNVMNHGNFQFNKTGNSPLVLAI